FSGRFLLGMLALVLVLLAAPFLVLRLHVLVAREWLLLVALVPLQLGCFLLCSRVLRQEYKAWLLAAAALDWTRVLCPTLLACAYAALLLWQRDPAGDLELASALEQAQAAVADIDASLALATLAQFLALIDG